jgi:hypothetical protein
MNSLLELVATLSARLFTGASIYINLVEHPARMSCGTPLELLNLRQAIKGQLLCR